jgi:hypothetical protein
LFIEYNAYNAATVNEVLPEIMLVAGISS